VGESKGKIQRRLRLSAARLNEDERAPAAVDTLGRAQEMIAISESDLRNYGYTRNHA